MKHILTILVAMLALGSYASEPFSADTIHEARKSWMTRFLDYFNDANKNKKQDRKSVV